MIEEIEKNAFNWVNNNNYSINSIILRFSGYKYPVAVEEDCVNEYGGRYNASSAEIWFDKLPQVIKTRLINKMSRGYSQVEIFFPEDGEPIIY